MKQYPWFTFIEIAIAIFVFSVGILSVLQVMTSNLSMVAQSQTKTTAAMLAQEGIALTFSLRDANRAKWYAWDCIPSSQVFTVQVPVEDDFCEHRMQELATNGSYLLLGFDPEYYMSILVGSAIDTTLYIHTGDSYYLSTSGTQPSKYKRHIRFEPILDQGQTVPVDKLLKVTSTVQYQQGADTGMVQLESFIWAW